MNTPIFALLGWPEIMGIGVIVLILFGAKKVPELMKGLGHGIKEFKKATRDVQEDIQRAIEEDTPLPPRRDERKAIAQSSTDTPVSSDDSSSVAHDSDASAAKDSATTEHSKADSKSTATHA